ncbi:TPA: hypothetical protein ACH3X1_006539 [Trebouxia sp. C0004]
MVNRKVKYMLVNDSAAAWCETAPYFLFSITGTKQELKEALYAKVVHQGHAALFLQDSEGDFADWDEPIALPTSGTVRVKVATDTHPAGLGDTIASDQQVALQLLANPVSQEPQGVADLEAFLFHASARLPVSVQPFQLIKSADPNLADALYLSGDCRIRRVVSAALLLSDTVLGTGGSTELDTTRWIMKFSEVLEALDSANPSGVQMLLQWNSSEKEVSYVVSKSASGKGAARVDTVASACRLSLLFGEDKVVGSRGLEEAWRDLQAKLASGFPALFYGQIPYLLVYAAAGVNIQFGRLLPLGQVERVGRVLNVTLLADRILLCCVLVNIVRLLVLWVKHAPEITDCVPFHKPMERPHGTRITLKGTSAVKEISDSQAFFAEFGHSFEAIQAAHLRAQSCHSLVHHSCVEEVEVRKRGPDGAHMTKLRVVMTRLGYTQASVGIVPEHVMQKATQACLLACACLHSAKPKAVCHCDVRFANVLWDPEPFLADLEFAHFSPWQVKQDFSLQDWDEGTLDDMGCYTPQSDTYQIGVMLLKSRHLSTDGLIFAQKLKSKTIKAVDAAEDPYLQTPIPMPGGGTHIH